MSEFPFHPQVDVELRDERSRGEITVNRKTVEEQDRPANATVCSTLRTDQLLLMYDALKSFE